MYTTSKVESQFSLRLSDKLSMEARYRFAITYPNDKYINCNCINSEISYHLRHIFRMRMRDDVFIRVRVSLSGKNKDEDMNYRMVGRYQSQRIR